MKFSDEELIKRYKTGEAEAADELMRRYVSLVRARARSYFLVGGEHEDLLQEGMIGLFKAMRDFNPDKNTSFKSFATMCISRQLATALKLSNRAKHQPLNRYISLYRDINDDDFQLKDILEGTDNSPEDILIDKENADDLNERIKKLLSSMEKKILVKYIQGMSYSHIAGETDSDVKAVDNALQRIKKKLMK